MRDIAKSPLKMPALYGLAFAALVVALDQLSKWWILYPMRLLDYGEFNPLPFLRFVWVQNFGVSYGLLTAHSDTERWALVALMLSICSAAGYWLARTTTRQEALALGAVVGGGLSNLTDRVRLGYVNDFINLHFGDFSPFYVFNIADCAIVLGVVGLIVIAFLTRNNGDSYA
jgi:signal peptidase II